MMCQKTGAVIRLNSHGIWLLGDTFFQGNFKLLLLRVAHESLKQIRPPMYHYDIDEVDNWFDQGSKHVNSTLISTKFTFHGMEGKKLVES